MLGFMVFFQAAPPGTGSPALLCFRRVPSAPQSAPIALTSLTWERTHGLCLGWELYLNAGPEAWGWFECVGAQGCIQPCQTGVVHWFSLVV